MDEGLTHNLTNYVCVRQFLLKSPDLDGVPFRDPEVKRTGKSPEHQNKDKSIIGIKMSSTKRLKGVYVLGSIVLCFSSWIEQIFTLFADEVDV